MLTSQQMRTSPARQDSSDARWDETVYDPPFIFILGQDRLILKFVWSVVKFQAAAVSLLKLFTHFKVQKLLPLNPHSRKQL